MKTKIAKLTSLIFHPIIFALLIPFIVVYHRTLDISDGIKWVIFSAVFVSAALLGFFILKPVEFLADFDISKRELRPAFYTISLIAAIIYFIIAVLLKGIFYPLTIVALGVVIGIALFEVVNFYLKASIHVAVACAFIITFGVFYGFIAFVTICWIPFAIIWSRLLLKKHTWSEVVAGASLGSFVTLLTFAIARLLLYN